LSAIVDIPNAESQARPLSPPRTRSPHWPYCPRPPEAKPVVLAPRWLELPFPALPAAAASESGDVVPMGPVGSSIPERGFIAIECQARVPVIPGCVTNTAAEWP
jgi:hypothetical protein